MTTVVDASHVTEAETIERRAISIRVDDLVARDAQATERLRRGD